MCWAFGERNRTFYCNKNKPWSCIPICKEKLNVEFNEMFTHSPYSIGPLLLMKIYFCKIDANIIVLTFYLLVPTHTLRCLWFVRLYKMREKDLSRLLRQIWIVCHNLATTTIVVHVILFSFCSHFIVMIMLTNKICV